MKILLPRNAVLAASLFAGMCLLGSWSAVAQTYREVYSFSVPMGFPPTNADGAVPYSTVILSGNVLYGTTYQGGSNGAGGVFSVHIDGTHFTNLHSFGALSGIVYGFNSDGAQPYAPLVLSSNVLYGTASGGGASGYGTIFRMNTDGTGFTNLHSFTDGLGAPRAGLTLSSNVLYGTTFFGGAGYGSVFRINIDGRAFTNLHSFTALSNDADSPEGGLLLISNRLYGTAGGGGNLNGGVVFSVSTVGTGYTNLCNFLLAKGQGQPSTNSTGGQPYATLLLLGNTLYGTTLYGGTNGNGVVFAVNTDGTGFTNLHTFAAGATGATNSEGASPECQLVFSGGLLYGTTLSSGVNGFGTIFEMNTNGSGFHVVYPFQPAYNGGFVNQGGANPAAGLLVAGNTFYGTTTAGGQIAQGNVYALTLSVSLGAQLSPGSLVLSWPNSGLSLQATPALNVAFTNVPGATSPYTNPTTGLQQFFRLVGQ